MSEEKYAHYDRRSELNRIGDNFVDITDFNAHFLLNFIAITGGGTYGPGQSVPEPSTVLLLGLGGALLAYAFGRDSLATQI